MLAVKLQHYGVCGAPYALLTDLMWDRYQIIVGSGGMARSEPLKTELGVAQGSSISNILFSLLLTDLPNAIRDAEKYMYREVIRRILSGREGKNQVALICCALSKAFDVADRDVLTYRLISYSTN